MQLYFLCLILFFYVSCFFMFLYFFMYNFTCSFFLILCVYVKACMEPRGRLFRQGASVTILCIALYVYGKYFYAYLYLFTKWKTRRQQAKIYNEQQDIFYIMCVSTLDIFICNYVYAWLYFFYSAGRRQQFQNMHIFMCIKMTKKCSTTCIH